MKKGCCSELSLLGILPERLDKELGVKRILGGGFALVDTKGMMVYRYPAFEITWEERNWIKQFPQFADALKGKEIGSDSLCSFRGKEPDGRLHRLSPPSAGPLRPVKEKRMSPAPFGRLLARSAILFGSVLPAAFLLALVFSRRSQIPLKSCADHALALGRGEERKHVPVQSISEFKDLAAAFNDMAENLRMRQAALRESEQRFRLSMEATNDGLWDWNAVTDEFDYSPSYYRILGY